MKASASVCGGAASRGGRAVRLVPPLQGHQGPETPLQVTLAGHVLGDVAPDGPAVEEAVGIERAVQQGLLDHGP